MSPGSETSTLVPAEALAGLPRQLRADVLGAFEEIVKNFAEGRWEPSELNGGKLCEAAYSVCVGICSGTMPDRAEKPRNFPNACQMLERDYVDAVRSARIQIPRMLIALYEVRNNRGVGHVGGDVDPNHMDAVCVLQMSKWVVAEMVRVLHDLTVEEAATLVDALVEREVPLVWKINGQRRVLDPGMSMPDKTLLLLHGCAGTVREVDVFGWTEHSNSTVYRRDVLKRLHQKRYVEYDQAAGVVTISPTGIAHVETRLLGTVA